MENIQCIHDPETGFQVVHYRPTRSAKGGETANDVVAFRGTLTSGGWADDSNGEGVGAYQFAMNEADIRKMLASAASKKKPDVTGHSLGGALAQRAAINCGSLVGNIITFQSPGLNKESVDQVDENEHKSSHYRRYGDLVPGAGEGLTSGSVTTFGNRGLDYGAAHLDYPLADLNALREEQGADHVDNLEQEDGYDDKGYSVSKRTAQVNEVDVGDTENRGLWEGFVGGISELTRNMTGSAVSPDKASAARTGRRRAA